MATCSQERLYGCLEIARQGRDARQASKDEVTYRHLYQQVCCYALDSPFQVFHLLLQRLQALQLQKEKVLLEVAIAKEASRTIESERSVRRGAIERYYFEQVRP